MTMPERSDLLLEAVGTTNYTSPWVDSSEIHEVVVRYLVGNGAGSVGGQIDESSDQVTVLGSSPVVYAPAAAPTPVPLSARYFRFSVTTSTPVQVNVSVRKYS